MGILTRIDLEGYKSIRQMSLELRPLNVLIGANGAGKSNLVSFFRLVGEMIGGRLQRFVAISGGADALLFYGAKRTPELRATLAFDSPPYRSIYEMRLHHAPEDALAFRSEGTDRFELASFPDRNHPIIGVAGHRESKLHEWSGVTDPAIEDFRTLFGACRVFHFHDTSSTARIRQSVYLHDNRSLQHDAGNLAAIVYKLKQTDEVSYRRIVETIRQVAPWFDDFVIEPLELNPDNVRLDWRDRGSDKIFGPHQLSDGSLRAIALITLLLHPEEDLPRLVVIDEPELGLHPHALHVFSALASQAAHYCQVIVATQSVSLLDEFDPEDVIVVDREGGSSTFKRVPEQMSPELLKEWLDEYSLSDLWEKNVIGGGPL